MLAENETSEQELNKTNGLDPFNLTVCFCSKFYCMLINWRILQVGPVPEKDDNNEQKFDNDSQPIKSDSDVQVSNETAIKEEPKHVNFSIPDDSGTTNEVSCIF